MINDDAAVCLKSATKLTVKGADVGAQAASVVTKNKRPVILDMGEASREQGFMLNGCR